MKDFKKQDMLQITNIAEHIQEAMFEARKRHIEANAIIVNPKIAISSNLFGDKMIMGLKVYYKEKLPLESNFVLCHSNDIECERIEMLEKENAELRKTIAQIKELLLYGNNGGDGE